MISLTKFNGDELVLVGPEYIVKVEAAMIGLSRCSEVTLYGSRTPFAVNESPARIAAMVEGHYAVRNGKPL